MKYICLGVDMRGFIVGICLFVSSAIFISTAKSEVITPSHVYQKTEVLRLTLERMGLLDTHLYENVQGDDALRHPRHVMQKVQECHSIIAKFLIAENIDVEPFPQLHSIQEVRPSDVQNGVDYLLDEVQKLGDTRAVEVEFVAGKLPGDVYNNLKRICGAIRVDITASDVYPIALAINDDLNTMIEMRGYNFDIPVQAFEGKSPADVYEETQAFLMDMRTLGLNPDFAIPGGVIVTNDTLEGRIAMRDIMSLMYNVLAETGAMKYSLGDREHSNMPVYQTNKTPSDIFAEIERGHRVVQKFLMEEGLE
ncbi:MAG: hypothetical protein GW778_01435 [Alphaproteobacteria bacterium]|nr:hypothetical protein [Alphaproteobacteria bacterium]